MGDERARKVFITPQELSERMGDANLFLVDARPSPSTSLPRAVVLDWMAFGQTQLSMEGRVASPSVVEAKLRACGLNNDHVIVVFGNWNTGWGEEGRLFWMFDFVGCKEVYCLEGGVRGWEGAGNQCVPVAPPSRPTGNFVASPALHTRMQAPELEEVVKGAGTGVVVVDCRETCEYNGYRMRFDKRFPTGHVPSAMSHPWKELFDASGRILARERILARLPEPNSTVVVYCTGGVRAGFYYMVLVSCGVQDVKNYDGSWWEWCELHKDDDLIELDAPEARSQSGPLANLRAHPLLARPFTVLLLVALVAGLGALLWFESMHILRAAVAVVLVVSLVLALLRRRNQPALWKELALPAVCVLLLVLDAVTTGADGLKWQDVVLLVGLLALLLVLWLDK